MPVIMRPVRVELSMPVSYRVECHSEFVELLDRAHYPRQRPPETVERHDGYRVAGTCVVEESC